VTALRVLRRAVDLGVNLLDTADSYGPFVTEDLIAEALHPYSGVGIATKGGYTRQGPNAWEPLGRPAYLRQCVEMSLRRLKLDCIDLYQLHRVDPLVPFAEQVGELGALQAELARQRHRDVLDYCTESGIPFIPFFPLQAGELARTDGVLEQTAAAHGVAPAQVALAWLLHLSPVMLPIPGTSQFAHLEENLAAASLVLSDAEVAKLGADNTDAG
jgi:aryl-alcohol dehydrogenase-like predicted oxidoreductase